MLTNKRERARQQRTALWATRDDVQRHALSMSLPWLAFVNIAFALMIFSRNFIFTYFDKKLLTHQAVIPYIEIALIAVIIISACAKSSGSVAIVFSFQQKNQKHRNKKKTLKT